MEVIFKYIRIIELGKEVMNLIISSDNCFVKRRDTKHSEPKCSSKIGGVKLL
ncbi:hypothetical protein J11TS1_32810 [Oceanobacillus sp. J11TS1]|nr:hypothetical protein J11TS1_32810 [Oceanobacillus sp. J11TS1]